MENMHTDLRVLGCKGLKTSCNHNYMWSTPWMYDSTKCKCLVNIILQSSTFPPRRVPCVHKNWSSVPLVAFLATKINKEQQPYQKIFLKTPLQWQVHTTDMFEWNMSGTEVWLSIFSSLLANSLIYQFWKILNLRFQRKAFLMKM